MIALSVNQVSKAFGATEIFNRLSMDVKEGERLGLIGPNGCGKTTLMKILMGVEDYHEGVISFKKGLRIGYLNQTPDYDEAMKVKDVMTLAFEKIDRLKEEMTSYEAEFANLDGDDLEKALKKYGDLSQQFEHEGGYEVETRLSIISEGLKIPAEMMAQTFGQLSGGEKTRVELAKTLLEEPDVMLLDEPSNHLDMMSIEWLEEFLKTYKGTVIIISHDRYFLDRVVTRIVEMSFDKLTIYHGNYSYYVVEKERRFLIDLKFYENQQKEVKRVENQIKRYRVWGTMRDSEKMFKKAKELEKRLSKMTPLERPKFDNKKVKFAFNSQNRSGKRVLVIEDLAKSYDQALFNSVNFDLFFGESLCLIGDNGTGKSTILKMIVSSADEMEHVGINHQDEHVHIEADHGEITIGSRIKVGYLAQEVSFVDDQMTMVDYFSRLHNVTLSDARRELAKVLFVKDDVMKKIGNLSGGEKSRLKLCSLMFEKVNLLVLDEPTNHLDIDSREILEETLIDFEGTLLFVSHDRYFIAKIANRMGEIRENTFFYYAGNYDYYREAKAKEKQNNITATVKTVKVEKQKDSTPKVPQKYLMAFEEVEKKIELYEEEQARVASEMEDCVSDVEKLNKLYSRSEELELALLEAMSRWEELSLMISGD